MGSRSFVVILSLVLLVLVLPGYTAEHGTRGTGEEDPVPEEGPALDGYYNLSMIDPLLRDDPRMIQMVDDDMAHHAAFSKMEIGAPSTIFYSKYSSDLESLVIWKKIVQGNYLVPFNIRQYLGNTSIQFIEWRYNDQDDLYYPDLKMISIDEDGDPVTGVKTLSMNISPPLTLEDIFDYPYTRRLEDTRATRDMSSSDGEKFYYIHGPMCNHGGTSTMKIIEKDRNGTVLREVPWIRFLAEGQFEQGAVCHDVLPLDWNQVLDAPFTILLRVRYFAGFCYMLLKVNEDLEMDKFEVILPIDVTDIESLYDDRTIETPTTGETYSFTISNISSDLLAHEVKVEVDLSGRSTHCVSMSGESTMGAELEIPLWFRGPLAYRYHFIDPFGLEFVTPWKYKTVVDNDPPLLHLPLINRTIECGYTLILDIQAEDNIGLGSVAVNYHLGEDNPIESELLMVADREGGIPEVPVPDADLRWELEIPEDERGPLQFRFSVEDTSGLEWTSETFNVTLIDRIAPILLKADDLTVTAKTTFEHAILVTDNWEIASYDWNESPLHGVENQISGSIKLPGSYYFMVQVLDTSGNSVDAVFTITVLPEPTLPASEPTGIIVHDTGEEIPSEPDRNGIRYKPHYWGEHVIEPEDEEKEKDNGWKTTKGEIMTAAFIGAFIFVASLIALLFAFSIKIQEEDLLSEE